MDLKSVSSEDIVALSDVDDNRAANRFKEQPKTRRFKDFRQMVEKMANEIDAVVVTTPDQIHAAACLPALEKKVITQVGNQGHAAHTIRLFVEMLQAGAIGDKGKIIHGSHGAGSMRISPESKMKAFTMR